MLALLLSACAATAPGPAPQSISVAILALEAKGGVPASSAQLLTEALAQEVRATGAFSRVATSQDLEAALGFDRQKQLINCDNLSCLAEVAGALNVDLLLAGSVGKLGESYVVSLKLLDARSGTAPAAVTERIRASSEDGLLDRLQPMVRKLVGQLRGEDASGVGVETAALPPPLPIQRPVPLPAPVEERTGPRWGMVALGVLLGAPVPLLLLAALAAAGAAGAVLLGSYDISPYGLTPGSLVVRAAEVAFGTVAAVLIALLAGGLGVAGLSLLLAGALLR